jgi:DNA gyrase subunit B
MITALGTGLGEEFDITKLRYHRVIVMTDADVDGSHIRTLILTFLYRQMPELIERGHVYIAVPPLYKVKLGNQEFYFEKDAQLEELLARERIPALDVRSRDGSEVKFTPAKWAKFTKTLIEYDGWLARLRSDFNPAAADFMVAHRFVELDTETPGDVQKAIESLPANGYELDLVDKDDVRFRVRVSELATSAAHHVNVPVELIASPAYRHVRARYAKLADAVGLPPFTVANAKRSEIAETYEELRHLTMELAKEGIQLSRFKGLGEMNELQLWETTMDPARLLLIRVDVEDASAADRLFSMLMGDQVEPRRLFIEQNAKDVRFLDV